MPKKDYILLVDGNNVVAMNVHSHPDLMVRKGRRTLYTGGLYGTLDSLRALLWQDLFKRVSGVVFIQDFGRPEYRIKLCPEYKSNRTPLKALKRLVERGKATKEQKREYELLWRIKDTNGRIGDFLAPFGVAIASAAGWEADDVAAYLVTRVFTKARFPDSKIMLLSGDKDWNQLINKRVCQRTPGGKGKLLKQYSPHARLVKVMCGDTSDHLKGVIGIGEKGANKLMEDTRYPTNPEELRRAIKKFKIPTEKGPAKLLLEQWDHFVAQWKATSMKKAVKIMEKEETKIRVFQGSLDDRVAKSSLRKTLMRSLLGTDNFGDLMGAFGSAFTKGRMAGVFDALEEL
jgi:5'-3' exonuclease